MRVCFASIVLFAAAATVLAAAVKSGPARPGKESAVSQERVPPVALGAGARLPEHPRSRYSRFVNWRPADGETVDLNPPRFSWPYWPRFPEGIENASYRFQLEIADNPEFRSPVVRVETPLNFYNALPALKGAARWYWRVGYVSGGAETAWSRTHSFSLAPNAVEWDRFALAKPDLPARGHPRILFNAGNLDAIRRLRETDPASKAAWEWLVRHADRVLAQEWWNDFPRTDREKEPEYPFYAIAHDLAVVAFVWKLSGDARYAGVVPRAVTWASYPKGGRSSPEGAGGDGAEDATQGNEFLALLFDWLYNDLSAEQRAVMIRSLEWRTDHWMNSFAWRAKGAAGAMIRVTFYRGKEHLGDQRHGLESTYREGNSAIPWGEFDWRVNVPDGADSAAVELFNYYRKGSVSWSRLEASAEGAAPNLVANPGFGEVADGQPAGWRPSDFGTGAKLRAGLFGRSGPGVRIECASDAERGAWGQTVRCAGVKELRLTGDYLAMGMSDRAIRPTSLSGCISSHQYEGSMDSAVMGLALYEHSPLGREWFDVSLNYLIGVTNGFGFDEAWNEGPGYGNSKMKWLMNASLYFDTALPEAHLGRNPYYRAIGDFFARVTPVGLPHSPWGNTAASESHVRGGRVANFRKLAYLTGEGRFLKNYRESGGKEFSSMRPWIEYVLPHYYRQPEEKLETELARVFPIEGWVTAASRPPSSREGFREGVGIVFQCRTRGGYSHSFNSDNSFQIHAYGQQVNHGGGSTANQDAYAYHTMSHNTILVDGLGQAQPSAGMEVPWYARVVAFQRGEGCVYFAGDATRAYPQKPGQYSRWGIALGDPYTQRDASHLRRFVRHVLFLRDRYFVVFDDLQASKPARFTWLYHVLPEGPFRLEGATARYSVNDVDVVVTHVASPEELEVEDRRGEDALVNPFTGEDYRKERKEGPLCGHNLWVTNRTPKADHHFLSVVYPSRQGDPAPRIERLDDWTVRVEGDVVSFRPESAKQHAANVVLDVAAVSREGE